MYHPYYRFTTGPAVTTAPHLIWGADDFKKRYYTPLIRKLRREIPDEVFQVIAEVAAPTVETPQEARLNLAQQEQILRAELKAQNIAWRKAYRDALVEIIRQENEDQAILLLLADF